VRRLRRECPWDREQDERSIVPHTVEEAYELADAAARGDDGKLADELGDVLFQVYFLSLLLEERGAGSLEAVADGLIRKLVRRHPHVFGDEASEAATRVLEDRPARTADDVRGNWERIKREVENDGTEEPFRPIPETLPALLYARKALKQTSHQGGEPLERAAESLDALAEASRRGASAAAGADPDSRDAVERALGETLLAIVDAARALDADPELALRAAAARATTLASVADPPPVSAISELVLEVADLERAREFYRDVLGLEETLYGEGREGRYWYLVGDSARLGLWTPQTGLAGGRGGAHVHFAFRGPREALDELVERLGDRGAEVEGPIQLGADRAIYVTDPDGNVVEFWSQDMSEYAADARAGGGAGTFKRPDV
jgi:NTP pyrophosphatase (non-canonical NTP hydrolase)/catechol 2,3-dioxygenase-like lactoylglutathione lyase family enzyme